MKNIEEYFAIELQEICSYGASISDIIEILKEFAYELTKSQESVAPFGYISDTTYSVTDAGTVRKTPNDVFKNPLFTAPPNYEALLKENERLREALKFYAQGKHYSVWDDGNSYSRGLEYIAKDTGEVAREALKKYDARDAEVEGLENNIEALQKENEQLSGALIDMRSRLRLACSMLKASEGYTGDFVSIEDKVDSLLIEALNALNTLLTH